MYLYIGSYCFGLCVKYLEGVTSLNIEFLYMAGSTIMVFTGPTETRDSAGRNYIV